MKALASVLEVDYEALYGSDHSSSIYVNIQLGYHLILTYMMAAVTTLFSTLTTKIADSVLEWHFSLGFPRRTVPINETHFSKTVRNKVRWGLVFGSRGRAGYIASQVLTRSPYDLLISGKSVSERMSQKNWIVRLRQR